MDAPADFYYFSVPASHGGHYAFVFSPNAGLFSFQLNAISFGAFNTPVAPDAIVIVGPDLDPTTTLAKLRESNAESEAESVKERLANHTPLIYLALSPLSLGKDVAEVVFPESTMPPHLAQTIRDRSWVRDGLAQVFSPELVIHRAPPGHAFLKPSGESSTTFLKPEFALSTSPRVSFVAFSILKKIFDGNQEYARVLTVIYVDTMAISPVAFALRELLQMGGSEQTIRISSFHSYDGMENISNPMPMSSLCLISASSSMSLQDRWLRDKGVSPSEVITLVTQTSARNPDRALFALDIGRSGDSEGPQELCIKIYGESFIPALETPKKVLLRYEAHRIDVGEVFGLRDEQVFDVYTPDRISSGMQRTVNVNGQNLIKAADFTKWVKRTLPQLLRANCRHIIHQNDPSSAAFADELAAQCDQLSGLRPICIPAHLVRKENIEKTSAILICAAVVGRGSDLLQVSRALRDLHDGPRLYMVGFQVTDTREEIATLRNNLRFREPYHYDYAMYASIATGSQLWHSFKKEVDLYRSTELCDAAPPGELSTRIQELGTSSYTGKRALMPFGNLADTSMKLRTGFAFWHPKKYEPKAYHAEVIVTIAGILQRAREDKRISEDNRLSSPTFRHILLDPENFARYNDGVIQGAILRCAYPSELDYRSDYSSSDFIAQLIVRLISRMNTEHGEAALEFLVALSIGRLKLHSDHLHKTIASIDSAPVEKMTRRFMHLLIEAPKTDPAGEVEF
ncbi:hypothetical protein BCL79_0844 [Stenotrophomonas rhizophila]|uniref:Uncharacterized protein n=1 Tax=Stenotrophomonas rhizophila TaxID=216778 RepID=A0A498CRA3_9GAMM|nr:hypothetical protein [Stenotrophomonas rhizophila]RLK56455.1 hypothetical protein BCL79_0844 [Stenotrophomonas rhizophila]